MAAMHTYWNPLDNDGDALRLANKAGVSIIFGDCLDDAPIVTAKWFDGEVTRGNFPDPYKATRRAIVLAVAQKQLAFDAICA